MSEIESQESFPPKTEVARPDIPAPKVDSLGRSMEKKRGRPPGGKNKESGANESTAKTLQTEITKRLSAGSATILSDENVGKAIAGAFASIGLFRGGHWRLFQTEEREYGECFGPLARLYGPEELAKWITLLMTVPLIAGTVGPRIAVENLVVKKEISKEEGRLTLLRIRAMMAAENELNLAQQVKEGAEYLKSQAGIGMQVAAAMKKEELEKEAVIMNGVAS